MEVYYHSAASTDNFTTDSITPQTYPSHTRLFYTANTTLNPHFHVILIPSATASSPVSSQTFTQLVEGTTGVGAVAVINFGSMTDYSLFAYKRSVNNQGYCLNGFMEPDGGIGGVPGIMGYGRKNNSTGEFTEFMMSRGSYLKLNNMGLITIGGPNSGGQNPIRTARVLLNDNKINIYKVTGSGRNSYKIYGKNVTEFNLYGVSQNFQSFNNYNYTKSLSIISNYYCERIDSKRIRISWYSPEAHNMSLYYWNPSYPQTIYQQTSSSLPAGTNSVIIVSSTDYFFRLEGQMVSDNFIDLTESFGLNLLKADAPVIENDTISIYPNPTNNASTITYSLKKDTQLSLILYNSIGQIVKVLHNGPKAMGIYSEILDASQLSSGLYYCVLTTAENNKVAKIVIMK